MKKNQSSTNVRGVIGYIILIWFLCCGITSAAQLYQTQSGKILISGKYKGASVIAVSNHMQMQIDYERAEMHMRLVIPTIRTDIDSLNLVFEKLAGSEAYFFGKMDIRECLFNPNDKNSNLLNQQSEIYKAIASIAHFRKESNVLKFGRMFIREISKDGNHFHLPECNKCTLAFSRILYDQEVVFIYNTSNADVREEYILIDHQLNKNHKWLTPVYGYTSNVEIHHSEDPVNPVSYIKLYLRPMQLVILKTNT